MGGLLGREINRWGGVGWDRVEGCWGGVGCVA